MRVLRTPDARFVDLPGYPFEPRYLEVGENLAKPMVESVGAVQAA